MALFVTDLELLLSGYITQIIQLSNVPTDIIKLLTKFLFVLTIKPSKFKLKQEPKLIYRFKSGETFEIYPYYRPLKICTDAYSLVCKAIDTRTNNKIKIKKARNIFVNKTDTKILLKEIKLMNHFNNHPNLMCLLDAIVPDRNTSFTDIYLVMPNMHLSLDKLILKNKVGKITLRECDVQNIIYQISLGLLYMHSAGVTHSELKPVNVLLNIYCHKNCPIADNKLFQVKITDFSLAKGFLECNRSSQPKIDRVVEHSMTRYYAAPEALCGNTLYDSKIDIWSLGCIMGEIYFKKPIFRGSNHQHQLQIIFYYCGLPNDIDEWVKYNATKEWISQLTKYKRKNLKKEFLEDERCAVMSDSGMKFLDGLLQVNPNKRWNIKQALSNEWLKDVYREKDCLHSEIFDMSCEKKPILKTDLAEDIGCMKN